MNANLFFLWTRAHENARKHTRDWRLLPHSCNQFHVCWHVFSSHWTIIVIRYSSLIDKMSFVLMSRRKCDKPLLLWNEGDPAPIYILCIAGRHVLLTGRWMSSWSVTALLRMRDMTSLKSLRCTWFVQRCASRQSHTWSCHVLNSLPVSHQRTVTPTLLAHAPCDVIVLSSLLTVMTYLKVMRSRLLGLIHQTRCLWLFGKFVHDCHVSNIRRVRVRKPSPNPVISCAMCTCSLDYFPYPYGR